MTINSDDGDRNSVKHGMKLAAVTECVTALLDIDMQKSGILIAQ
jgi:hypothetical protein